MAPQTLRSEALIQPGDRDPADVVLRRTAALLADVQRLGGSDLAEAELHLAALVKAAATISPDHGEARYVLYADACRLRRQIAFRNPLLDFQELLFAKRHRAIYPHMCDQYYGIAAMPGGGLYVLSDPFGSQPQLRDVLADSVVRSGRLTGQKLSGGPNKLWRISYDGMGNLSGEETVGGSFLSPDVSYDGQSIVFAYVECTGARNHDHHTDPSRGHWAEGRSYHVFQVNVDGSNLVQLTDGTWNDFDPRWLPSGRIAFVSERRGGYLRCGRVCPTYTLYDMAADGGDIRCLSPHETNEWHPSVTNDGRIAWTRWDYVDRHFSAAHMPWITTVDGRDPRPIHGNYAWRGGRPDMELNLRAIPNSPKFVATAAPHHGQAFGSLVIIDPRVSDDDGGSPLKRLTPDAGFPETGDGGTETYGAAWPLSEDYHLCVYDASTRRASPNAPAPSYANANYGIYLVDAFGNRELVYRDPDISCHQPIPLRPRRKPPVVTENSERLAGAASAEATVAVMDVYQSLKPWPAGTKITALRVWQILPLSVAPAARNNGIQVPGTGSVNTGRAVLGTVPVEADGSAHFAIPAGKEVFFQALDEQGLAVQSMRSGTHFQAGRDARLPGLPRAQTAHAAHRAGRVAGDAAAPVEVAAGRGRDQSLQLCPAGPARAEQALHRLPRAAPRQGPAIGRRAGAVGGPSLHGPAHHLLRLVRQPGAPVRILRLRRSRRAEPSDDARRVRSPGIEALRVADQGPLRRETAARRPAPPDRLARFVLDVLRRVRKRRRRGPTAWRSRPAHVGVGPPGPRSCKSRDEDPDSIPGSRCSIAAAGTELRQVGTGEQTPQLHFEVDWAFA